MARCFVANRAAFDSRSSTNRALSRARMLPRLRSAKRANFVVTVRPSRYLTPCRWPAQTARARQVWSPAAAP
eukprot:11177352-Lingulodinium_polyedra.AAC.1